MQGASTSTIQKHTMVGDNMYGNCRLCFAIGQHQHTFGMAEMEILMENLNLFLLADPRLPHLLCSDCITSLDAVQHFRRKVLATETELLRVIAEGIKQTTTPSHVSVVLPSQNDPLEMGIVKTEHESDEHEVILKFEDDDADDKEGGKQVDGPPDDQRSLSPMDTCNTRVITEAHQNESSMDMDTSLTNIKTEQHDFDQNNLLRNVVMTVAPGSAEIKNTPSISLTQTQSAKETRTTAPRRKIRFSQSHIVQKSNEPYYLPEHIAIDDKIEIATNNTKIRANLILIIQHSTILPFRYTKTNLFKCFYCETICSLFKDLRKHTESEHRDGESDYTIFRIMQSRQQKNLHADISCTKCKVCDEKFVSIDDLVEHLTGVHGKVYYTVKNADKGPSHGVLAVHLNTETFKCHFCEKEFRFYKPLTSHMSEHYNSYVCTKCGKTFVTAERLKNHFMSHNATETKCPDCHKMFKSSTLMKLHRNNMHLKQNRYVSKCAYEDCSVTFPVSQPLKKFEHMERVHGIKKPIYKCEECEKTYKTVTSLYRHKMTIHVKANEFKCDICNYCTTEKGNLSRHIDNHNSVKKYECDHCQKKFRSKYGICVHLKTHTKNNRFACSLCKMTCSQKGYLKVHIKSKHPNSGIDIKKL